MRSFTWLVISTIVSLLMILISYAGITRYVMIHLSNMDKYTKDYNKLPDSSDSDHVKVVTRIPDDEKKIDTTVKSLLDQTVKVDEISAIPAKGKKDIPNSLKSAVKQLRAGKEYVGCQDLALAIRCTRYDDTWIVWVKPGYVYGRDVISTVMEKAKEDPSKPVISKCGRVVVSRPSHYGSLDTCTESSIEDLIYNNCPTPVIVEISETYPALA